VLERNQLLLESAEERAARQVALAYNAARRELVDVLITRWTGPGTLTPDAAVDLLRRLGLLQNIDARLLTLEQELGVILRDSVTSMSELALEQIGRELALLPPSLRPNLAAFTMIDTAMIEQVVPVVMEEVTGLTTLMRTQLRRELQNGLLQGESFPNLVRRLMAVTPSGEGPAVWANGQLSAERMTRRTVITANNMAKQRQLERVNAAGGVRVQKQWVASIGSKTTDTCLRLHGQIRDVDQPFDVTGEPRFARQVMTAPAHWSCRSSIAMYVPAFEEGAMTTPDMRAAAIAEQNRRED
jgi:hypothetical protein